MRRRRVLASIACGTSILAGCATRERDSRSSVSTSQPTPPPDVTTLTETKPLPEPSEVSSSAVAQSFVETYEQRYVYNELVGGFGSSGVATEITVEPARVAVVHTTDSGYYVLSSCRGSARYYRSGSSASSATRNASSVAHFVSNERHRRIPFNAYRCERPVVQTSTANNSDKPLARLQIYDFESDPDYEHPEQGGRTVNVTVWNDSGEAILEQAYQTSLPLTIQPAVTETPGSYTLAASLADGPTVQYEWDLSTPETPSWWALCLAITAGGRLAVKRWYPNEEVGVPSNGVCRH